MNMRINRFLAIFAALVAGVLLLGGLQPAWAQQSATSQPTGPSGPSVGEGASSAYVLGRDDAIEVSLVGGTGFNARVRVQADGQVQLPLIGKVMAADRTTTELADTIAKALKDGGFYASPIVNIEVVGYASRYVVVLGSVGNPGLVPINRPYHLSEILARVGGVRDGGADYIVVRSLNGQERKIQVRDIATGDATQDPLVTPGDKIFAPPAEMFYIYGQVNTPGAYPVTSDLTARQAIARGGGLTESGTDSGLQVTRGGKKVKLGLADKIQPGDVIFVKERLF
jgi:polysaccharide export outer membrane protein